jgi:hypothetical protein
MGEAATKDQDGWKSWQIPVAGFRQIMIWPLTLRLSGFRDTGDAIRRGVDATNARLGADRSWQEIADLIGHAAPPYDPGFRPERGKVKSDEGERSEPEEEWRARCETWAKAQDRAQTYGEFVFFYDFLQSILYRPAPRPGRRPPFRLWRRLDVGAVEFDLNFEVGDRPRRTVTYFAGIDRLNLYVFETGAAILVAELDFGAPRPYKTDTEVAGTGPIVPRDQLPPAASATDDAGRILDERLAKAGLVPDGQQRRRMTLEDVLAVTDYWRRAYTPFFYVDDYGNAYPSMVPQRVRWLGADRVTAVLQDRDSDHKPLGLDADMDMVRAVDTAGRRTAPVAGHWLRLVEPLDLAGHESSPPAQYPASGTPGPSPDRPVWRHVVDERIPIMSYVSLTGAAKTLGAVPEGTDWQEAQRADLGLVSRGDWVRLCQADAPGGDTLPYSPGFLRDFAKKHCYDRYWPDKATTSAARFLFAGYHFAVVGAGALFHDKNVVHHFRRHYFQMGLLANMELASLLATSSRISEAVHGLSSRLSGASREERNEQRRRFREEMVGIEEDFLEFVHLFRFTGVSNQIQPTELFDRWRASLRLEPIYEDVKSELDTATHFVLAEEQARQAEQAQDLANRQTKLAEVANRLAEFAAVGVVYGLALALAGANLVFTEGVLKSLKIEGGWAHTAALSGILTVASLVGHFVVVPALPDGPKSRAARIFKWGAAITSALAALFGVVAILICR